MGKVQRIDDKMIPSYVQLLRNIFGTKKISGATISRMLWHYYRKDYEKSIAAIIKQMNLEFKFHLIIGPENCTRVEMEKLVFRKAATIWPHYQLRSGEGLYNDDEDFMNTPAQILIPKSFPLFHDPRFKYSEILIILRREVVAGTFELFYSIVAHEIAHVLLHAVGHPGEDQEVAADIVAMLLGFLIISIIERRSDGFSSGYLTHNQLCLIFELIYPQLKIIYL